MEILEQEIYTSEETKSLLKISQSTFLRLIKRGVLKAYKVGGQYRILGREILGLVSPSLERKASDTFKIVKNNVRSSLEKIK